MAPSPRQERPCPRTLIRPNVPAEVVVVLGLEVRASGVEQQHVALQPQPARDREEHAALNLGVMLEQGVLRPVGDMRIGAQVLDAGQQDVMGGPLQRRPLASLVDHPVRDQRE